MSLRRASRVQLPGTAETFLAIELPAAGSGYYLIRESDRTALYAASLQGYEPVLEPWNDLPPGASYAVPEGHPAAQVPRLTRTEVEAQVSTPWRALDNVSLSPMNADGNLFWLEFKVTGYLQRFELNRHDLRELRDIATALLAGQWHDADGNPVQGPGGEGVRDE